MKNLRKRMTLMRKRTLIPKDPLMTTPAIRRETHSWKKDSTTKKSIPSFKKMKLLPPTKMSPPRPKRTLTQRHLMKTTAVPVMTTAIMMDIRKVLRKTPMTTDTLLATKMVFTTMRNTKGTHRTATPTTPTMITATTKHQIDHAFCTYFLVSTTNTMRLTQLDLSPVLH